MQPALAAVDLAPLSSLLFIGAAIAAVPLAWVWLRGGQAGGRTRLQALTLLALFLTFDLVLFGAFTRLTDSGLGCPDWPGCYGSASPSGARAQIDAAQAAMPTGPVTHAKAWIEMAHRYFAAAVGALVAVLAVMSWRQRKASPVSPWWPIATLVWVCIQGAFGALTVTMKLFPAIVTLHLLGGMLLLALLCRQAVAWHLARQGELPTSIPSAARAWLGAAFVLLWLQVALGGWVSTNYAVLACADFPTCQGQWWPPADFRQGFELWRELGKTGAGDYLRFDALVAIHLAHRLAAYVLLMALLVAAWRLGGSGLRRAAKWIFALAVLQVATGLSNVVLGWPLAAAVLHTGGAAALVVVLTWAWSASRNAGMQLKSAGSGTTRELAT